MLTARHRFGIDPTSLLVVGVAPFLLFMTPGSADPIGQDTCAIRASRSGPNVELHGEIRATAGAKGTYQFSVVKRDSAGRSVVRQSGQFLIGADGTARAGSAAVNLGSDGKIVAELTLSFGDYDDVCRRTIKGGQLGEL